MCSPREPREGIHGRPWACCLAYRMSLPANCLRHSETPSGVSHDHGGYAHLTCRALSGAPATSPWSTCPRRLRPAVSSCISKRRKAPGNTRLSILRTLCSLDAQAQGRHAAPRAAPSQGSPCAGTRSSLRLRLPRPAADGCQTRCCATRLSPLQTARGPDRQGRTGALRRRNWPRVRSHARGCGRYPGASHGPSPSHLSETGALGTSSSTPWLTCVRVRPAETRAAIS
jgi:hypothetical protein